MTKHFNSAAATGLLLYVSSLAVLLRNKNFELGAALIVLVLFGIIFPALAWFATIGAVPLSISVRPSPCEMLVLVACIIALSIYLVGGAQWVDDHLPMTRRPKLHSRLRSRLGQVPYRVCMVQTV